ncbi:pyridoxamine 5'-phosphate oxidase [Metapseudomonas otitidis]|uniref:pyridoxamine 5'-phosphate oxidase n=1 Tax=Metapseudomonas otitidis TaxID=319939 RepID=UPI00366BEB78
MHGSDQLSGMRRQYRKGGLLESQAAVSGWQLLREWVEEALHHEQPPVEPNAMSLATVDAQGQPHCRVVLLKGIDERGLVFYTHHGSAKGQELAGNARAALLFHWPALERQLRIEGTVERVEEQEADAYFASRPLPSRLACWASEQSRVIKGRGVLEARLSLAKYRFLDNDPPRPEGWGGYRVVPACLEFWQGRTDRLHDRLRYQLSPEGWHRERLAP